MDTSSFIVGRTTAVRARTITGFVPPATTGLLTTVSTFGLLAPVTFAKTGGSSNLTINTSTGGISATAGITIGQTQSLTGTATGADGVVIPFSAGLTAAVSLGAVTLSSTAATAGIAWEATISGGTAGSTFTAASSDGTPLAVVGNVISGTFSAIGTPTVTVRENNAGASNSPRFTAIPVTVTAVSLGALSLSATSFTIGSSTSGTINGATVGSTITATGLPSGFTINGAARTWSYNGGGSAATSSIMLTETLGPATRDTPISITIAASGGTALPAPTLTRVTGPTTYPPQIDFERPVEWIDGDQAVMQRSQDPTFATGVSEAVVTLFAATTSYNLGLSAVASGIWYFRMAAWRGSRPGSLNWSNITAVGDTVAPTITSSASPTGFQYIGGSLSLTANEPVSWQITGGADNSAFTLSGSTLSWPASPATGSRAVQVTATDYAGNQTSQTITLTNASNQPNAFSFTNSSDVALSTVTNSNTITLAGGQPGTAWPFTYTGAGTLYKRTGGAGPWVAQASSGTVSAGDQVYVGITSSGSYLTALTGTLTVGTQTATYTVTTMNNPASVNWTLSTAQPTYQQIGFSSASATFANIDFGVGLAVVCVHVNGGRSVTNVTIGGVAGTLVVSNGGCAIYSRPITTAGNYNVAITASATIEKVAIIPGTLTGYGSATPTSTVFRTSALGASPLAANGPLTIPTNGLGLQFAGSANTNAPLSFTGGTTLRALNGTAAGGQTASTALGATASTLTPAITGTSFDGTASVLGAAWGV